MNVQAVIDFLGWNLTFWLALASYSLACLAAGVLIVRAVGGADAFEKPDSPIALAGVAAALGLGFLGQLWTLLALAGLFVKPVIYTTVVLLVATLAIPRSRQVLCNTVAGLRRALTEVRLEGVAFSLLALAILLAFLFSLAAVGRPFSGDALALHIMIPKLAAASGMLERHWFQPGNEYFGLLGEMTYAALMAIGNDDAAQMVTWVVLPVFAAVLAGTCGRCGIGVRGKIIALAALASTTAVLIWIGEGKIDLMASSLGLTTLYLLVPRADLGPLPRYHLMLAGLLAGFAVTAKLMLGFCLVVASAVLLFWTYAPAAFKTKRPWQGLLPLALVPLLSAGLIFGAFLLLGIATLFIKNGMLLSAPFAPLGTAGTNWLVRELWYDAATVAYIRLTYPFVITFGEYFAQYGNLSVLVLAFLPLALFMPRPDSFWRSPLTAITVAAVIAIIVWATFQGDKVVMRYILPVLLLCVPLAAA
jgi:hypothetical protein